MPNLEILLSQAAQDGKLLESTVQNIRMFLHRPDREEWELASVGELAEAGEWSELNDRFYQTVEFGTGGLRGRTIGKVVTRAEQGQGSKQAPEHPAAGTNTLNFFTIGVATQGLVSYLREQFPNETPGVAISYDSRLFSPGFARLAAKVISDYGGVAHLFGDVRPTPELSFAVRSLSARAGIMVTASHNPPHDNGFKAYYLDGAQVVDPYASAILDAVSAAREGKLTRPAGPAGRVEPIGPELDDRYLAALKELILQPEVIEQQRHSLKVVYTPIHGTGVTVIPRLLKELGIDVRVVPEQEACDGLFPTVKSPNPENREALALAVKLATESEADAVIATDPDCDRMGVAVRNGAGEFEYLTGNQIGSLLAHYRLEQLFQRGILTAGNAQHAAVIKTLVTTDLMQAIAAARGVKCVETLTGFKHIGAKLLQYEKLAGGKDGMSTAAWRDTLLRRSTYNVFAAEESYGYLAEDYVRDKDAAAASLEFVELLAFARQRGVTVIDLLNELYLQHGYYGHRLGTLTFEGEEGAAKIRRLLASYKADPPGEWSGQRVLQIQNYAEGEHRDVDGTVLPHELMLTFRLEGGGSVTTRASGTEPKIKFYFSARGEAASAESLPETRQQIDRALEAFWTFTQSDVQARVA